MRFSLCGVLHDLVPFVQFKEREKHPWRSVTFKACNLTKSNTPPCAFFTFFRLYKWYHIAQRITYSFTETISYTLVIARFRVQYDQYFQNLYFANLFHESLASEIITKYETQGINGHIVRDKRVITILSTTHKTHSVWYSLFIKGSKKLLRNFFC